MKESQAQNPLPKENQLNLISLLFQLNQRPNPELMKMISIAPAVLVSTVEKQTFFSYMWKNGDTGIFVPIENAVPNPLLTFRKPQDTSNSGIQMTIRTAEDETPTNILLTPSTNHNSPISNAITYLPGPSTVNRDRYPLSLYVFNDLEDLAIGIRSLEKANYINASLSTQ